MSNEDLKKAVKQAGLEAGEDFTQLALAHILKMGKMLVDSTETEFDNVAYNGLVLFKGELEKLIDKIDGVEGN